MAITLGTFTKLDSGAYTGMLKTLHVTTGLVIVPVDKMSDKAPDHRVYTAGQRYEIGAGWSQVAKSSGETYLNLKIGAPEFRAELGPLPPRQARTAGRRRLDPHGALGTARRLTSNSIIAPPRQAAAAGFFTLPLSSVRRWLLGHARRAPGDFPGRIRCRRGSRGSSENHRSEHRAGLTARKITYP